jgi:hypothetical protein
VIYIQRDRFEQTDIPQLRSSFLCTSECCLFHAWKTTVFPSIPAEQEWTKHKYEPMHKSCGCSFYYWLMVLLAAAVTGISLLSDHVNEHCMTSQRTREQVRFTDWFSMLRFFSRNVYHCRDLIRFALEPKGSD